MSERLIHTGYWYVPLPESTRGGQHVGTPRGVLVYDETLQLGVLSFSERSQFKSVADANALLDLGVDATPGACRAADLSAEDVRAMRAVYEAAIEWRRTYRLPFTPEGCSEHRKSSLELARVIDAHPPR